MPSLGMKHRTTWFEIATHPNGQLVAKPLAAMCIRSHPGLPAKSGGGSCCNDRATKRKSCVPPRACERRRHRPARCAGGHEAFDVPFSQRLLGSMSSVFTPTLPSQSRTRMPSYPLRYRNSFCSVPPIWRLASATVAPLATRTSTSRSVPMISQAFALVLPSISSSRNGQILNPGSDHFRRGSPSQSC
jgi:hypothetical protein